MKLLVRPTPAPLESWPGYLHRLALQNHLDGIQAVATLLGTSANRLLVSNPGEILKQLGVRSRADEDIALITPADAGGRAFLARAGRTLRTRMCPRCLREDRQLTIPAEWDGAFSFTCLRHHTALLDVCPVCAAPLTYERSDLTRCRCGHSLWMTDIGPVASVINQVLHVLALTPKAEPRPTFVPSTEAEVHAAWLVKRLAIADAGLFRVKKAARLKGDAFVTTAEVLGVSRWFADWPNGFLARLAALQLRHNLAPSQIIGLGPAALSRHLPSIGEAMMEFDRRKRTGKRPVARLTSVHSDNAAMGIKQLMIQTGCCYGAIQNWIRFGWLGEVRIEHRPRGDSLYFIPMPMALRAIAMIKQTSGIQQLAQEIGVEPAALRALVRAGVISSVPVGAANWNVRLIPTEVFKFARALLDIAVRGRPNSAETLSISTALCRLRRRDPVLTAEFLRSVLSGRLRVRRFVASPITLHEISLREDEFTDWILSMR